MTPHAVSFTVIGQAQPKGSTRAFMRPGMKFPVVTSDNKSAKGWETSVRAAAQQQCGGVFFDGAVRVGIVFFLPRPKSAPRRVVHHMTRPDLDKLCRCACDALTGILWKDDSQIVDLVLRKGFAMTQPHARIIVDVAAPLEEIAVAQDLFSVLDEVRA